MIRTKMFMYPNEYRRMFELEDAYWWYRGMRVFLRRMLARYAPAQGTTARLLDVGCGSGANLELLSRYGHAVGIDIAEEAIAFCRARGIPRDRAFLASATDLPFPCAHFDSAISFDVICNIADDARAFAEIVRVLKHGACLIIQVPAHQWLWSEHDVAVGHARRYSAHELRSKLSAAGLEIVRMTYANVLLMPLIAAVRLTSRRAPSNGRAIRSDLWPLPRVLNGPLSAIFATEMRALTQVNLPYGLSLVAVARKRADT